MMDTTTRTLRPLVLDEVCDLLGRTPRLFDAWLRGLPEPWIQAHEGQETWSPFAVVGHLLHGELHDWIPRARLILEHGTSRPFEPYDRFGQVELTRTHTLDQLLDRFAAHRVANIEQLRAWGLAPADLDRRGVHPAFGPVTLGQLLATWVAHDQDHVVQVARVVANQYSDAVGPWRAYLRVISGQQG